MCDVDMSNGEIVFMVTTDTINKQGTRKLEQGSKDRRGWVNCDFIKDVNDSLFIWFCRSQWFGW